MVRSLDPKALLSQFLKSRLLGRPLLLGYSGGPDSKALLYALLENGVKNLHLAHVDHGWREASREEAKLLKEEAENLGCPFHTIRLGKAKKGNLEDKARKGRLAFFESLFLEGNFQAVLLAHQADDLAETALKRLLEGAHLAHAASMEEVSRFGKMVVWRPFLNVEKKELLAFLEKRGLKPLIDATNFDPAFLRARMREETVPFLNRSFGKEVGGSLRLFSKRSAELRDYLNKKIESACVERGAWGLFAKLDGLERVEQRHLLLKLAKEEGVAFPRSVLESFLDWTAEKAAHKRIELGGKWVALHGGFIFFIRL